MTVYVGFHEVTKVRVRKSGSAAANWTTLEVETAKGEKVEITLFYPVGSTLRFEGEVEIKVQGELIA